MGFFGRKDEAEKRFKQANIFSHPEKKAFNLDEAIRLLEEAVNIKPNNNKYRQKLEEIRELKSKNNLKFSMKAETSQYRYPKLVSFKNKKRGYVFAGRIEQGVIKDGDEVLINGHQGTVYEVVAATGKGQGCAGQEVLIATITEWNPSYSEDEILVEAV